MTTSNRINFDTEIQMKPTNFIRSGFYNYSSGGINSRNNYGPYWQSNNYSHIYTRALYFLSTLLNPQDTTNYKGYGYSLRYLVRQGHWQLPTYDGTKSYQNLLVEVYGISESYSAVGVKINSDSSIQFPPFNFIRSGFYIYSSGQTNFAWRGSFWYSTISVDLLFNSDTLRTQDSSAKGFGLTLRCLVRQNRGKLDKSAYV